MVSKKKVCGTAEVLALQWCLAGVVDYKSTAMIEVLSPLETYSAYRTSALKLIFICRSLEPFIWRQGEIAKSTPFSDFLACLTYTELTFWYISTFQEGTVISSITIIEDNPNTQIKVNRDILCFLVLFACFVGVSLFVQIKQFVWQRHAHSFRRNW